MSTPTPAVPAAAFSLRITDSSGGTTSRDVGRTSSRAWKHYMAACHPETLKPARVELMRGDRVLFTTERKLAGTPDEYEIRTGRW